MDPFKTPTRFARLVADALEKDAEWFTLLDLGSSNGIAAGWRAFDKRLRALVLDPNLDNARRLAEQETLPGIEYVGATVALPPDDPGRALFRSGNFWGRTPWNRLSLVRTNNIRASAQPPAAASAAKKRDEDADLKYPPKQIVIPAFLSERGVDNIDFLEIDLDGPDFLILRSLVTTLNDAKVLGVTLEVNFHGSADADIHTFHNSDRLMKQHGFELFSLSSRPYSVAALPAPYQNDFPAETRWGRIYQGDATYIRDAASPEHTRWAQSAGAYKLIKLAAIFSLAGLPDCAAEVLLRCRSVVEKVIDVEAGLNALTEQCIGENEPVLTYEEYIAEFEADGKRFWPSLYPSQADADADADAGPENGAKGSPIVDNEELNRLGEEIAAMKSSKSWQLTAPLRSLAGLVRRLTSPH